MRKEIQEHFERLDREVVNINNEAARNYLVLNDKMNDVLQAVVELKNMLRQEEGGTPLLCSYAKELEGISYREWVQLSMAINAYFDEEKREREKGIQLVRAEDVEKIVRNI